MGVLDWVWIDINTILPINNENKNILDGFKKILVCPERWHRIQDVENYRNKTQSIGFKIFAVMASLKSVGLWKNL